MKFDVTTATHNGMQIHFDILPCSSPTSATQLIKLYYADKLHIINHIIIAIYRTMCSPAPSVRIIWRWYRSLTGSVPPNAPAFTNSTPLLVEGWTPCLSTCRVRGEGPGPEGSHQN
jgi:hypothetical protein